MKRFPWLMGLFSLAGAGLCLANGFGAELLCVTSGCSVYRGFEFGGISVYLLGAGGFIALAAAGVAAWRYPAWFRLLKWSLVAGLCLDGFFLLWQGFYWTCSSCLAVAGLLGLVYGGALFHFPSLRRPAFLVLLLLWFSAATPTLIGGLHETVLSPWPILGSKDAPVRVFFSPTCGACQQLLEKLAVSGMVGNVAFCPVAKNDEDVALLGAMVADGVTEASDLLKTPSGEWTEATLSLKFCLARNKMALARMGETGLPRVVGNDLFLSSRSGSWSPLSADPFGHSSQGGCGFGVDDDVCPSY